VKSQAPHLRVRRRSLRLLVMWLEVRKEQREKRVGMA